LIKEGYAIEYNGGHKEGFIYWKKTNIYKWVIYP
jgi:hypothetical protein